MQLFKDIESFALHTLVRAIQGGPVEPEKASIKNKRLPKSRLQPLSISKMSSSRMESLAV